MAANNQVNYNEPWILQRADPCLLYTSDAADEL